MTASLYLAARDIRHAARGLARSPGLVIVCALSLGLGIGLNAVLYMGVTTIYWHEPTARDAHRVVGVEPGNANQFSYADYEDLAGSDIFETVAGFRTSIVTLGEGISSTRTGVLVVTPNFFEMLGVDAARGRTFTARDASHGQEPRLLVVTAAFWRARLGGDTAAIGRTLVLDGERFEIVGVLPDAYRAVTGWMGPAIYVPASRSTLPSIDNRRTPSLTVLARLRPGSTSEHARGPLNAFLASLERIHPDRLPAEGRSASVFPLAMLQFRGTPAQFTFLVTIAGVTAALVLFIACVNVTGLLLARAADRRRELAIRVALGASRAAVIRATLAESFLLVLLGAGLGLPLAAALSQLPVGGGMGPLRDAMTPDLRVLPFGLGLIAVATLVCGLVPALSASRTDVVSGVKQGGEPATPRTRLRRGLVAAQVGMSFVLVVAALLCVRSQSLVARADLGFDIDRGVVARIGLDNRQFPGEARVRVADRLVQAIESIPGVEAASAADIVPLGGNVLVRSFHPAGRTDIPGTRPDTYSVGPGYFRALGIPVIRGRAFDETDRAGSPAVAIVNETFARTYFPGTDAIGRRVQTVDDPEAEVIGIVRDHRIGTIGEAPSSVVYYAFAQRPSQLNIHVRTATTPEALVTRIRQAIVHIEGSVPVGVETLRAATSLELTMRRTGTWMMSIMGGVALLLAVIGIYGVLAHLGASRTVEIGIRMALGASSRDVAGEMLRRAIMTVAPGLALGALASCIMLPAFATFLAGISPYDPAALAGGMALVLLAACAAGYAPARRASRVDPTTALRRLS